jgi:hypothetical protein
MMFEKLIADVVKHGLLALLKRFTKPLKIEPSKIKFVESSWKQKKNFSVYNLTSNNVYEVYIKVSLSNQKLDLSDLEIKYNYQDGLEEVVGNIFFNYEIIQFNCQNEKGEKYIILKISSLESSTKTDFKIYCEKEVNVNIKIIDYKRKEAPVLIRKDEVAVPFQVHEKIKLQGIKVLLKQK